MQTAPYVLGIPHPPGFPAFEREIAVWRRDRPVYVFADWVIGTEPARMPLGWAVERPTIAAGHRLYEVCPAAGTCTRSKYAQASQPDARGSIGR